MQPFSVALGRIGREQQPLLDTPFRLEVPVDPFSLADPSTVAIPFGNGYFKKYCNYTIFLKDLRIFRYIYGFWEKIRLGLFL